MSNKIQGTVKWFKDDQGYGLLTQPAGADVYCHFSQIQADPQTLTEGQAVEYEMAQGPKGTQAVNVYPLD